MSEAVDVLVDAKDPMALDATLRQLPGCMAAVVGAGMDGGPKRVDGYCVVRVFAGLGFFEFALERQGYGKVIRRLEALV